MSTLVGVEAMFCTWCALSHTDMTMLLKKYVNTVLIIITVPLILFLSCLLLLEPLATFTVSL
jgi:hypothetical protein